MAEIMEVDEAFGMLAVVLCNRATDYIEDDELANEIAGLTTEELFDKCVKWIDEIVERADQWEALADKQNDVIRKVLEERNGVQ